MPPIIPKYDVSLLQAVTKFKEQWLNWNGTSSASSDLLLLFHNLTTNQVIQVLQDIFELEPQPLDKVKATDQLFNLGSTKNAEIKFRWLRISLKAHWEEKIEETLQWLNTVGRMKYVRPLYRDLYNWEEARPKAIDNFQKNWKNMMYVTAYTAAKELHLNLNELHSSE